MEAGSAASLDLGRTWTTTLSSLACVQMPWWCKLTQRTETGPWDAAWQRFGTRCTRRGLLPSSKRTLWLELCVVLIAHSMSSLTSCPYDACCLTHRSNALSVVRQQDAVIARQEAALASRAEYLYRNVRTHTYMCTISFHGSKSSHCPAQIPPSPLRWVPSCSTLAILYWMACVVRTCRCCGLTLLACVLPGFLL